MLLKAFDPSVLLLAIPIIICFLIGGILIYINYQRNVKIQKKLKSNFLFQIENEKIKISRELHDAVTPFTLPLKEFIKKRGHFTDENAAEWLNEINNFESYLSSINERIFPTELLEGDFFEALQKMAERLYSETNKIEIHTDVSLTLSKANSIQIFRIIQESLINAIKYSNSSFINIINTQKDNDLVCFLSYEVNDEMIANKPKTFRRGHKIIKQRLELLSAKFESTVEHNIKTEKFIFKDVFQ